MGVRLAAVVSTLALPPPALARDAGADATAAPGPAVAPDPAGAKRLWSQAQARLRVGDFAGAVAPLRQAHAKMPADAALATDLASALANVGERAEAESLYRRALLINPEHTVAYVRLAELLRTDPSRWSRRDEILGLLERGLARLDDNGRTALALELAQLEISLGRTAEARQRLQPLLDDARTSESPRRRAQALRDEIAAQDRARAFEDWPDVEASPADEEALEAAGRRLDAGQAAAALAAVDGLLARQPGWIEARFLRARALEALERFDEATRELGAVVRLQPSRAEAWRRLGVLLALHGGALDAPRADEALRHALALEPGWSDLRALRARVARKLAATGPPAAAARLPEPSPRARTLFEEAQTWANLDAPEVAGPLVAQALAESPAFFDAAVLHFTLRRTVPQATTDALAADGQTLWRLAQRVMALDREGAARALTAAWTDRAVDLGVAEAQYARAVRRAEMGDKTGALSDLRAYLAREAAPAHLAEARALRASLGAATSGDGSPESVARRHLFENRAADALKALGGPCRDGLAFENTLALALVHEFTDDLAAALRCLELAAGGHFQGLPAAGAAPLTSRLGERLRESARARLSAVAARAPVDLTLRLRGLLETAAGAGATPAFFALARIHEREGRDAEAFAAGEAFLRAAGPDDPHRAAAETLARRLGDARERDARARTRHLRLGAGAGLAVALIVALAFALPRLRTISVARALDREPSLYPDLARAVSTIRHDVLKHRASALGLLGDPATDRAAVARSVLEPQPISRLVAGVYEELTRAAAAHGLALAPAERDPVFGPLLRDLAAVERALARATSAAPPDLIALDARLRGPHADALARLLARGPRTALDAATLTRWIDAVRGEHDDRDAVVPQLLVEEMRVSVAAEERAVHTVFSNLLRNAMAAVAGPPPGRVQVRLQTHVDAAGRRLVTLAVADSARAAIAEADFEARDGGRGLGIVRDLARRWNARPVVSPAPEPFTKVVGVVFPAAGGDV